MEAVTITQDITVPVTLQQSVQSQRDRRYRTELHRISGYQCMTVPDALQKQLCSDGGWIGRSVNPEDLQSHEAWTYTVTCYAAANAAPIPRALNHRSLCRIHGLLWPVDGVST
jgi:hypothetical protein